MEAEYIRADQFCHSHFSLAKTAADHTFPVDGDWPGARNQGCRYEAVDRRSLGQEASTSFGVSITFERS